MAHAFTPVLPAGLSAEGPGRYVIEPEGVQDWPLVLERPGLYRLADDLDVPAGEDGLWIAGDDVCLDLAGHTLRCDSEPECPCLALDVTGQRAQLCNGRLACPDPWSLRLGPDSRVRSVAVQSRPGWSAGLVPQRMPWGTRPRA